MFYFAEKQIDMFCLYRNDDKIESFRTFFSTFRFWAGRFCIFAS